MSSFSFKYPSGLKRHDILCFMDIISHALWGGIAFGRKNRRSFLLATLFGLMPDLLSFGVLIIVMLISGQTPDWSNGAPESISIPVYARTLYNWTHSLLVFIWVFSIVWIYFRKPVLELTAWGLHVLMDIFTHTDRFFPTPFLWPLSDSTVSFIPWSDPRIFVTNVFLLSVLYLWFYLVRQRFMGSKV